MANISNVIKKLEAIITLWGILDDKSKALCICDLRDMYEKLGKKRTSEVLNDLLNYNKLQRAYELIKDLYAIEVYNN